MHLRKLKQRHRFLTTGLTVKTKKKSAELLPTEDGEWYSKLQGVQQNKKQSFFEI